MVSIFGIYLSHQSFLGWLWVLLGIVPAPNPNCIYNEQDLRDIILGGAGEAKLCGACDATDIVSLSSEIDISGASFSITCLENDNCNPPTTCMIEGAGGHRLFGGSPVSALFDSIRFSRGEAGEGGAFQLTGGTTQFSNCEFNYNKAAAGDGGALFVSGSSTAVTLTGTTSTAYNTATAYGGFLLATEGATVVIEGTDDSPTGITWNTAEESGGLLAAKDGATVEIRNMIVECGNQAKNGGDYLSISDSASVKCENVGFQVLATSEQGEVPALFNSTSGMIGNSNSCKSSEQVGELSCKRN